MRLSEFEIEVMQLFWETEESSAPEIHKLVIKNKQVTYSTVKTIIDRLEIKGAIKRVKNQGRTIIYQAAVNAQVLRKPMLKRFIQKVFAGDSSLLLNHLLDKQDLSDSDVEFLQSIVDGQKEKNKHND